VIKKIEFYNNNFVLEILHFVHQYDLYKKPIPSSLLNIYYVEKIGKRTLQCINVNDILMKCIMLPHKNGFAVIPLAHCQM
jgi:hypothetical protein